MGADGHFNVLRGSLPRAGVAGVKVVGDYVGNHRRGLPSELALLTLYDTETGAPTAILDATAITAMRTGAVTAVGAAPPRPARQPGAGHIGSRGTAEWNVRLLCRVLPELDEIRIHSRTERNRTALAARARGRARRFRCGRLASWEECVRGADVVVEATRLEAPEPLLRTEWIAPGALVVPYGTMSAVELSLTDVMDKVVVDDWGQAGAGPLGALRAHVDSGRLSEETLHAELGQIVCGDRPGRETATERILLWHRGLSLTDIALGRAMLERAAELGAGHAASLPVETATPAGERTPRPASSQPTRS